ncbi:acyl-homoserine-lactone synthase OpaM [Vibrio hyugaensis]|uniref:acyl-homoserine-lactone synthase n=1 Tax=Vibrio hyugaensis TaxID=1534743 RepID=A0ABQ5XXW0_9VIBR|nr:acyl-homoserine-lactone synthase [Vibrio hyugaensis]GLR03132.1 acyl-homoserine-lactone synthase OpaM [Vibrio hyugaensis]
MNFTSPLGVLSASSMPIEKKQRALINAVLTGFNSQERQSLFQSVTDYRRKQLIALFPEHRSKSYSVLFESMDYRDLVQRYPSTLSSYIAILEQVVAQCFIHWLEFWCECEIAAIKATSSKTESPNDNTKLPFEDSNYYGALIEHVEDTQLLVKTPTHLHAMSLSNAITLSNLELFVQGEKWYEMLPLLSLSQTGKHFILLKHPDGETLPTLVASALIQDWSTHETWLSYAPQFSNKHWHYCLPNHGHSELTRLQLFTPSALLKCYSLPEFDREFKLLLSDTKSVCEVLRLTVSGNTQQKLYFLYLAQKELMNVLHQAGYKVGFTIIEQPFMLNFYQSIDKNAYFHSGYCDLNNDGKDTYRGFWNFEMMVKAFSQTDFRAYKHAIREIRKQGSLARDEYV